MGVRFIKESVILDCFLVKIIFNLKNKQMVEATGPRTQLPGTEENKGETQFYVAGTEEDFANDVKARIEGVDLN